MGTRAFCGSGFIAETATGAATNRGPGYAPAFALRPDATRTGDCTLPSDIAPASGAVAAGTNAPGCVTGTWVGNHGIASSADAASERDGANASATTPAPKTAPDALNRGRREPAAVSRSRLRRPAFFALVFRFCMTAYLSRNASRALKMGFNK